MVLAADDYIFLDKALKYFNLPSSVIQDISYEETGEVYPDIWITAAGSSRNGPVSLTVTQEWKKQTPIERHKRLTHEILHITGLDHWEKPRILDGGHTLLYSTIPQQDTFSWMVYYNIINDIPITPIAAVGGQRMILLLVALIILTLISYT